MQGDSRQEPSALRFPGREPQPRGGRRSHDRSIWQRLFDRYQSEAAAFSRVFTALLIFSVLFLAFALVPYAVLQHNRHVPRRIAAAESELAGRVEEVKKLESLRGQLSAQVTARDQRVDALADQVKLTDQKTSAAAARVARNQEQAAKNAADQKQTKAALDALGRSQALIGAVRSGPAATVRELRTSFTAVMQDSGALQPDAACPANSDRTRPIGCRLAQRVTLWGH
jgi:septal ring factor EnvC (AmiA/AmiB activator)